MLMFSNILKEKVQVISKRFYDSKDERDFTHLCNLIQPTIYNISTYVLKDHDIAMINVNDVLMKIYNNMMGILTDKNSKPFIYKDTPFFSYVTSIAHNKAKMKYNKQKHSGIKYVFEASSEDDDSNQLVDILPTSSREYFDMNNNDYVKTFGDAYDMNISKCLVRVMDTTIVINPINLEEEPIPNKIIYKIKEKYKKHISPVPDSVIISMDMISMTSHEWYTVLNNDYFFVGASDVDTSPISMSKMVKAWIDKIWAEKSFVTGPKKFVSDNEQLISEVEVNNYVHNSDAERYAKVTSIIEAFNSNSILMDAMVNLGSYNDVAKKHNIGIFKQYESAKNPGVFLSEEEIIDGEEYVVVEKNRSSAIKTRVFRSKKTINRIMDSEILWSKMITEGLLYTGNLKLYFDNGKVKMDGNFIKSERHGRFIFYFDNGCVKKIINYDHNVIDGEYKEYSKSGSTMVDGFYTDGLKNGLWKYYKAKSVCVKIDFYFGVPGYYEKYSNSGSVLEKNIYSDGCGVGELIS